MPPNNLGDIYHRLGQHEKSVAEARERLRLGPGDGIGYGNLVIDYLDLNRLEEARATAEEARRKEIDSPALHFNFNPQSEKPQAARLERSVRISRRLSGREDFRA